MTNEYNMADDGVGFINGDMNLSDESPIEAELSENKYTRRLNERQFRNLIYETVLEMLDKQLNEDDPMAAGAPMPPAPGAPMDQLAGPGAMAPAPAAATDADALPGEAKKAFKGAEKFKDPNGGAKGFAPQDAPKDDKDKEKKELAEKISRHVLKQIVEQFGQKKK